jgi:hypothetical protein
MRLVLVAWGQARRRAVDRLGDAASRLATERVVLRAAEDDLVANIAGLQAAPRSPRTSRASGRSEPASSRRWRSKSAANAASLRRSDNCSDELIPRYDRRWR